MNTKTQIIATILNCSEENADFLAKLCNNFKTDFKYVWQITNDFYPDYHINDIICAIYWAAIHEIIKELNLNSNNELIYCKSYCKLNETKSHLEFNKQICVNYAELLNAIQNYFKE